MPWSNKSGGGWNGGNGNGGGPWGGGEPPRGGGGGGGQPPDLEDIIKKGQEQLRRAIPGGGGFSPFVALIVVAVLSGLYIAKSVYTVAPDELGVELRFGKPKVDVSEPGLHFYFWPFETYEIVNIRENQINIGSNSRNATSGLMLSGDQNIVDMEFTVLFQVVSPNDYLFNVRDPLGMVEQVSESAMREVVGRRPAQDVFRDDRAGVAAEVLQITHDTLEQYGTGLQINAINIQDVAPPREVADSFDEVQRAEQDEDRFIEEANRYSNRILGAARGEAAQITEDAAAYKNRVVEEAKGEAQRFISVYDQYAKAPEVTRKRLFLETMESVLKSSNKVILEQEGGQGVVPYLPLPEIQKRAKTGASQ
ncbi:MAG: FtsH protease activity modulator HflK [Rhizobiaceae bacterium]|nr:FtsH protease activity modulator HflK [Rhizobiaceae bacterium]